MGELTRKQHRVKRKLEERPQSLTQRDTDALDELLEAGNEKSRVEVLQASCSVAQGHPELFDEIRDTIADRLTKSELSALERHRAATLYGEVLISLLTDGETPSEKYITTLLDVNHSEAPLRVRRQVLSILGRVAASYPAAIPLQPIQDALIESIEGDHPYVAAVAAYALGHVSVQSDPKSGCDVLDTALYDHSPHLRAGAIRGLGVLAEAYPEFRSPQSLDILDYLGSDETEVRQAAISTLCLWAPAIDSELDTLEAAAVGKLESESVTPEQAITALEALGLTSSSLRASVVSTLESAFQDQTSDHGSPAGRAIGRIGRIDPSAVEDVIPSLRESLVPGLNGQSNDGGVSIIDNILGSTSYEEFDEDDTAAALAQIGKESPEAARSAVSILEMALRGEHSMNRDVAASVLEVFARESPDVVKSVVPTLIESLEDRSILVREHAAKTLGWIGSADSSAIEGAVAPLTELLDDTSSSVQAEAADALSKIARVDPTVIRPSLPSLENSLEAKDPRVSASAAVALGIIAHSDHPSPVSMKKAVGTLEEIFETEQFHTQRVVEGLGQLAQVNLSAVEDVVPSMAELLDPEGGSVRRCVVKALGRIGSADPFVIDEYIPLVQEALVGDSQAVLPSYEASLLLNSGYESTIWAVNIEYTDLMEPTVKRIQTTAKTTPAWLLPLLPGLYRVRVMYDDSRGAAAQSVLSHLDKSDISPEHDSEFASQESHSSGSAHSTASPSPSDAPTSGSSHDRQSSLGCPNCGATFDLSHISGELCPECENGFLSMSGGPVDISNLGE